MKDMYDAETGLPLDKSYLEVELPNDIQESIKLMQKSWDIMDAGGVDNTWDAWWCNLMADINSAEVDQRISSEQASYLRYKYLRMREEEIE